MTTKKHARMTNVEAMAEANYRASLKLALPGEEVPVPSILTADQALQIASEERRAVIEWPIDAPQEEPIRDMKMLINIRAQTHGDWREQSHHSQMLKTAMGLDMNASLRPDEREALELICVKISRILNGDAHLEEHWRDIAGYATLAADQNKSA